MADRLTQRERDVLFLIAEGLASKSIARRLDISEQTVRKHRRRLLEKCGAPNAAALCMLANQLRDVYPNHWYPHSPRSRSRNSPQES